MSLFYSAASFLVLTGVACSITAERQTLAQNRGNHERRLRNPRQTDWHVPTWRGLVLGKAARIAVKLAGKINLVF
jgi:hypothetical protein